MPTLPPWPLPEFVRGYRSRGLAVLLVCGACATTSSPALKSAGEIPALTTRLARDTTDYQTRTSLGVAYLQVGRADQARPLLERSVERRPNDPVAVLHLGLSYEALQQYPDARRLYEHYLKVGRSRELRSDLKRRLVLLERRELEQFARRAVEEESRLRTAPPRERTVAVFPFQVVSTDAKLRPLGRALADLLVIDLSQTSRVTVLERMRVQLLLDELDLSASGRVDSAQVVRSGRMLSAERIVQGSLGSQAETVQLNAAIVQMPTGRAGTGALSETDALNRIMAAEKRLALRIYESLGVSLTVAERERVSRQPTDNLNAILAYGIGLEALDAGNYARAAQQFDEAARLDPNFTLAKEKAEQTRQTAAAVATTTTRLVEKASFEGTQPGSTTANVLQQNPFKRDPVAEVLGNEDVRRKTIIELIFRRPN